MKVEYVIQPDQQVGLIIFEMLDTAPPPVKVVLVSAFVGIQTVMRLKQKIHNLKHANTELRLVFGIDLGGTSKEVLDEVLNWGVDVRIVKHRIPGHTFHPKLYLVQWEDRAKVILGSNNLTEGGFYRNYEGAVCITYELPQELDTFDSAQNQLLRFLDPNGPTVYSLNAGLLNELNSRGDLPTEVEARNRRDIFRGIASTNTEESSFTFGTEDFAPPPPLPSELLTKLRSNAISSNTSSSEPSTELDLQTEVQNTDLLLPAAFYMTLPTLQGNTIPGEGRIPLEAIRIAERFWGWPDKYTREASPTGRVYWNWRPNWRISTLDDSIPETTQEVRMYMYEDSSDFRFYVRPLVNAGADLGDVVRIRRIVENDAEYECILARKGTAIFDDWIQACSQPVRNSSRRFGYA